MLETAKAPLLIGDNMVDETMPNQQITDLSWLAAMICGEGYVGLEKIQASRTGEKARYFSPRVSIANTDPAIIVRCIEIMKSIKVGYYIMESNRNDGIRRNLFTARIDKLSSIQKLLDAIIPHMVGEKKARSQLLLEYVNSRLVRLNTPSPRNDYIRPSQRHKRSNPPYNDREREIAEVLDNWNPRDYTSSSEEILRRYSPTSEEISESMAEMTMPTV